MRATGWFRVIAIAVSLLTAAPGAGIAQDQDVVVSAEQSAMARALELSARLEGPEALGLAKDIVGSTPESLGVDAEGMSSLLTAAIVILGAAELPDEVDAAYRQRTDLSLVSADGTRRGKDLIWADRQEEYANWLAGQGQHAAAAGAQAAALEVYREHLGPANAALLPHLALYASWAATAGGILGEAELAALRSDIALRERQRDESLGKPLTALGQPAQTEIAPGSARVRRVRIFYATDRAATPGGVGRDLFYGSTPGPMSYGYLDLQVPDRPDPARLWADTTFRIEVTPDRLKRTVPIGMLSLTRSGTLDEIRRAAQGKEILIYVHGFKNNFTDAARVAANLHVDLDVRGATVFYSWPSQYEVGGYPRDERLAEDNTADRAGKLKALIDDLAARNPDARIYLVAHSMGNRIAAEAVSRLTRAPGARPPLKHLILASPDIAVPTLVGLAPRIRANTETLTLYSSLRDGALLTSHLVHACITGLGSGCPRAGHPFTVPTSVYADKLDTTLAPLHLQGLAFDPLGHDDFLRGGLTDVRAVIWNNFKTDQRCFLSLKYGYYMFSNRACSVAVFADALAVRRRSTSVQQARARAQARIASAESSAEQSHWTAVKELLRGWS